MLTKLPSKIIKFWLKPSFIIFIVLIVIMVIFFSIRIYKSQGGPGLELWHTFVPHEMNDEAIDVTDWPVISQPKTSCLMRLKQTSRNASKVIRKPPLIVTMKVA